MIGEGDSWFSHPTEWNILYHLSAGGGYAIAREAALGPIASKPNRVEATIRQHPVIARQAT